MPLFFLIFVTKYLGDRQTCWVFPFVVICIQQENLNTQEVNRLNRIYLYPLFLLPNKCLLVHLDGQIRANLNALPLKWGHKNSTIPLQEQEIKLSNDVILKLIKNAELFKYNLSHLTGNPVDSWPARLSAAARRCLVNCIK